MAKDNFGGTYDAQVLTSGPYPNQSFIGVFDTAVEITGKKANVGAMAFAVDDLKFYMYTGTGATGWYKSADAYVVSST